MFDPTCVDVPNKSKYYNRNCRFFESWFTSKLILNSCFIGKTTLAKQLKDFLEKNTKYSVNIVHQDAFPQDESKLPFIKDERDWEIPESIIFPKFIEAIKESKKKYDITIVEGFLVYYDETVISLLDKKIFLNISKDVFFERRRCASCEWGVVPEWYIEHIWNSFLKYGQPPEKYKNEILRLDGNAPIDIEKLAQFVLQ